MIISRKKYLWNKHKKEQEIWKQNCWFLSWKLFMVTDKFDEIYKLFYEVQENKIHTNSSGVSFVCCSGTVKNLENMISFMFE